MDLAALRLTSLSCLATLLILETIVSVVFLRYNMIQQEVLSDQYNLLRTKELLGDALRDSLAHWESVSSDDSAQSGQPPPFTASKALESVSLLRKLQRKSLAFSASDLDRLEDIVSNNSKLHSTNFVSVAEHKALQKKMDEGLAGFVAAIDIRLFGCMQEFQRETEFLQRLLLGVLPLLIVCTAAAGLLLNTSIKSRFLRLEKQSRRLTDHLASLSHELHLAQKQLSDSGLTSRESSKENPGAKVPTNPEPKVSEEGESLIPR